VKILVLGSSGQVGAYLCEYLKEDHDVITFDIAAHPDQDLRRFDNSLLENAVRDSDFVFFLAFDVGGSTYLRTYQNSFDFINNNVLIMTNVFSLLNRYGTKFLFASSQMSTMSHSTYGLLKAIGERYVQSLNGLTVHFWNVYGIEKEPEKFHVISDFVRMAIDTGAIKMKTTGEESREFLYGSDCAAGLETIMNNYDKFESKTPLHLTSFEQTTIFKVAQVVSELTGAMIIKGENHDDVQNGQVNIPNQKLLEYWTPKISLEQGISEVYHYMKNQ
jgi:nucleoside-diphosphate-sugar epimerase